MDKFDSRFDEGSNQLFLAFNGPNEDLIKELETIIKDIKEYGKPVQTNNTSAYTELQIITPI